MNKDMKDRLLGITLIIVLMAAAWWLGRTFLEDQTALQSFLSQFPLGLSAAVFVILYVASSFIIIDVKDILKVVSALLFGAVLSTLFIWIAELINCAMLFFLARRLGRAWIEKKFRLKDKDIAWVHKMCGIGQVFVVKTIPLFPYRILDLAYGLTAIPFRRYFLTSAVASPVRIFWLQFILAGVGGAVFQTDKLTVYLTEHVVVVRWSFVYLVVSIIAAFVVGRALRTRTDLKSEGEK